MIATAATFPLAPFAATPDGCMVAPAEATSFADALGELAAPSTPSNLGDSPAPSTAFPTGLGMTTILALQPGATSRTPAPAPSAHNPPESQRLAADLVDPTGPAVGLPPPDPIPADGEPSPTGLPVDADDRPADPVAPPVPHAERRASPRPVPAPAMLKPTPWSLPIDTAPVVAPTGTMQSETESTATDPAIDGDQADLDEPTTDIPLPGPVVVAIAVPPPASATIVPVTSATDAPTEASATDPAIASSRLATGEPASATDGAIGPSATDPATTSARPATGEPAFATATAPRFARTLRFEGDRPSVRTFRPSVATKIVAGANRGEPPSAPPLDDAAIVEPMIAKEGMVAAPRSTAAGEAMPLSPTPPANGAASDNDTARPASAPAAGAVGPAPSEATALPLQPSVPTLAASSTDDTAVPIAADDGSAAAPPPMSIAPRASRSPPPATRRMAGSADPIVASRAPAATATVTATEGTPSPDAPARTPVANRAETSPVPAATHDAVAPTTNTSAPPLPALAPVNGRPAAVPDAGAAPAAEAPVVSVHAGRIGHETGVAIARHVLENGTDTMTVRLDPKEFGRVEVKLSFDDAGTLRAVVAADNPASLDLLRRDAPELARALTDAGVRADASTLRFDSRGAHDGTGGGNGQPWQRPPSRYPAMAQAENPGDATPSPAAWRPLRTRGRIDLMA